ncbi:cytochrome c oxidase subunit II [Kyrpidia tusciae]|uniref:Cytochrome aa3 subunit 2 n=1 Tax=Kyrpidia tusciae (strain DSM 2912 / NBRC 15312 / T2) TaxID=562970 RepID=D5WT89_KYRT2|nr:cytochrome c oxidase subunit II [Kyrpidia tusciae]ADG05193.1 cytochrome c oxidase subunit II [Kyrpidia tusciae DSM 2912]MBE3553260.1 cytochrome c oxidase subunit II [Kyrpidia tusciae]
MHLHRYEKIWLTVGVLTLIAFIITLGVNAFAMGAQPPSNTQVMDPTKVSQTPPFDQPALKQIGQNNYVANMTAFVFSYAPNRMEVPVGSTVTFNVTSKDVVHGFEIPGTNVNMMIIPGLVNSATHTFTKPGDYLILCNEYCGTGHQLMAAHLIVK